MRYGQPCDTWKGVPRGFSGSAVAPVRLWIRRIRIDSDSVMHEHEVRVSPTSIDRCKSSVSVKVPNDIAVLHPCSSESHVCGHGCLGTCVLLFPRQADCKLLVTRRAQRYMNWKRVSEESRRYLASFRCLAGHSHDDRTVSDWTCSQNGDEHVAGGG